MERFLFKFNDFDLTIIDFRNFRFNDLRTRVFLALTLPSRGGGAAALPTHCLLLPLQTPLYLLPPHQLRLQHHALLCED